jgi:hypothetical protein
MIRIRCLVCREAFRWDATQGMPDYCLVCSEYIGSDGKDEVAAPFIATSRGKTPDLIYRDMENKSEFRAQQAAEMTGMTSAEVSHLRMTDMKTGMREGDMAMANNLTPQQQIMSQQMTPSRELGMVASAGTRVGPQPRAGMNYIENVLRKTHGTQYRAPVSDMTSMGLQVNLPSGGK